MCLHMVAASCDTTGVMRIVGHAGVCVNGVRRGRCRFPCCQKSRVGSGITGAWVADHGLVLAPGTTCSRAWTRTRTSVLRWH